jgi:murein DD-endopeptidase MepM/ murein hydrolase activator NlpD
MKPILRPSAILLITSLALSIAIISSTPSYATQLKSKRSELTKIKAKIELDKKQEQEAKNREASILREIEINDKKLSELTIEVQKLKIEVDRSTTMRKAAGTQLAQTEEQLKTTEEKLDISERKLAYKQKIFSERLRNIYKNGPSLTFMVILNSRSLNDLLERTSLINRIAENDAELVMQMKRSREAVAEQIAFISEQKKTIAKRHLFLIDEETHLKIVKRKLCFKYDLFYREQKRQQKMFAVLQKEKIKLDHDMDVLSSTSDMITKQIRMLEKDGDSSSAGLVTKSKGRLIKPCSARITSGFGWRIHPVLHYKRLHTGVDFGVPSGSTIVAADSGKVIMAGWMGGYGNAVVIAHGNGISTLYGHNSKLLVSTGDIVRQGQSISKSGSTGLSTGPHLHFEVRVNGTPKNPMDWF